MADDNLTANLDLTATDHASSVVKSGAQRMRESLKEYERAIKDVRKSEADATADAVKEIQLKTRAQDAWAKLQRAQSAALAEDTVRAQDKVRREVERTAATQKKAAAEAASGYGMAANALLKYAGTFATVGAAISGVQKGFMAFADHERRITTMRTNMRLTQEQGEAWAKSSQESSAKTGYSIEELTESFARYRSQSKQTFEADLKSHAQLAQAAANSGTAIQDWEKIRSAANRSMKDDVGAIDGLVSGLRNTVPQQMVAPFADGFTQITSNIKRNGGKIGPEFVHQFGGAFKAAEGMLETPKKSGEALVELLSVATDNSTNLGKIMAADFERMKNGEIDLTKFIELTQKQLEGQLAYKPGKEGADALSRMGLSRAGADIAKLNLRQMGEEAERSKTKVNALGKETDDLSKGPTGAVNRLSASFGGLGVSAGKAIDAMGGSNSLRALSAALDLLTKITSKATPGGPAAPGAVIPGPAGTSQRLMDRLLQQPHKPATFNERFGFATGGEFVVPGSGGTDTTPVDFMATPGEKVSIDPQGGTKESLKVQQDKADMAMREHFARFHRSDRARQASLAGDLGGMYDAKGKYTGKGGPGGGGGGGGGGGDPAAGTRTGTGSGTGGGGGNQASGTGPADTGLKTPVGLDPASSTGPAESLEEAYKRGYLKPPGSGGVAGATNPYLAQARAPYFEELDKNPALKTTVMKIMASELGGTGLGASGVLESMIDRSRMAGHKSLQQAISSGFYGPVNRGEVARRGLSAKERADAEAMMARVRAGSRDIGLRTDQGQQWEHWADKAKGIEREGKTKIGGEWFSFHNKKWSDEEMRKADESLRTAGQAPVGTSTAPSTTTTTDLKQSLIGAPEGTGGSPYPMTGGASARGAEKSWSNMTPEMRGRMAALYQSAPPEIQKQLSIHSGWRSLQTQAALHAGPHTAPVAAPTPNAPHVRGDAADMTFATPEARAWVHANAGKYGLHFPMAVEPWHIQVNPAFKGSLAGRDAKPATPVDTAAIEQRAAARYKQAEDRARITTAPTAPAGDTDDGIQGSRAAGKNLGPDVTPGIRPFGRTFRQEARRVRNLPYAAPAGEGRASGKGIAAKPIVVRPVSAPGHEERAAGKGPRPVERPVAAEGHEERAAGKGVAPVEGLAEGGTAAAGGQYLVGEQGPEMLQMGGQSGNVISNANLRAQFEKPIEPIIRPRIQNMGPASMRWTRHAERNRDQDNTRRAARESHVDLGFA